MGNFFQITQKTIQAGKMTDREISAVKIAPTELKLTDAEAQMLKHDINEVKLELAQAGLMLVGLIPGWGEPADATSAAIDFATGHPISGTISAFCACPVAGWLGDIPLAGIRIYRLSKSSLKCGRTVFILAKANNRAGKIFVWMSGKVIEFSQQSKSFLVHQKNVFDPNSVASKLYKIFAEIEKTIKSTLENNVRIYGHLEDLWSPIEKWKFR